jgi:hypothetical protein
MSIKLTVCFDGQFWVGFFERFEGSSLRVCKHIFGTEPGDSDVLEFVCLNYNKMIFSPPVIHEEKGAKVSNPKRLQRMISREISRDVETKAQEAIKLLKQTGKSSRKKSSKLEKDEIKRGKYIKEQMKKKEKKRGH